jgi:hypothetical protein
MPITSGFMDRYKGKIYQPTGSLQQIGAGGAVTLGGGQLNTTSAIPASSLGVQLSSASTAETTLLSYILPARSLDRPGRNLFIAAYGTFSTSNNGQKTARLYFGSEVISIAPSTTAALASVTPWYLQLSVFAQSTMSSLAVQTMVSQVITSTVAGITAHQGVAIQTGNENTLLASTIKVTGTSSSPTVAGDVTALSLQVEALN